MIGKQDLPGVWLALAWPDAARPFFFGIELMQSTVLLGVSWYDGKGNTPYWSLAFMLFMFRIRVTRTI